MWRDVVNSTFLTWSSEWNHIPWKEDEEGNFTEVDFTRLFPLSQIGWIAAKRAREVIQTSASETTAAFKLRDKYVKKSVAGSQAGHRKDAEGATFVTKTRVLPQSAFEGLFSEAPFDEIAQEVTKRVTGVTEEVVRTFLWAIWEQGYDIREARSILGDIGVGRNKSYQVVNEAQSVVTERLLFLEKSPFRDASLTPFARLSPKLKEAECRIKFVKYDKLAVA